ncbi:glutathione S-transferase [Bordetella genomosp. 5]|uniref:glutathione S-transferase family protein n=1 Tax=Bordetella genomosp. 5 TaxID=1395608 RepID=UPI000B9E6B01|nr:glutathione S-transferase family protein [Bordetella genomosp. 5]OZI39660.1 glutathione S-transferase [Bordetella genomosp. 5]
MILYDTLRSGNAWKARLMAAFAGIPLERRTLSIDRGDLARPAFLDVAPLAHVPVLQLPDGSHLPESQGILFYLAQGTPWWPATPLEQARVLSWMGFEQDRHMKPLAQLRLHLALHQDADPQSALFRGYADAARAALAALDAQLARQGEQAWVATAAHPSIADVALYPYTRMAPMGGIALEPYPAIGRWLRRLEALPGYQPLFPGQPDRNLSTAEHA